MARTSSKRYEGDSWDLASSVGATATMVAAQRALLRRVPIHCSMIRWPIRWSARWAWNPSSA
jgi:hypothetical protein